MLTLLKDYKGKVIINGTEYSDIHEALKRFKAFNSNVHIQLLNNNTRVITTHSDAIQTMPKLKKITVKQYMTKKSSPGFDFMARMNNDIPMPLRTMIGTVEKETPGMVYMKLHADITEERTKHCLKCGRIITNPVSQYFGMGPECGGHNYVNPFYNKEELFAAVKAYREELKKITWEGWIIKSAITEEIEL